MRTEKIIEITKKGTDFGLRIPAGTTGNDVELGLATAINDLAEREKLYNPDFTYENLLNRIRGLIGCIKRGM